MADAPTPVPGLLGDFTARLLREAGIGAGMRVLDYGCGPGDVSLHLAALVGTGGHVVGIDRDEAFLAKARERARAAGLDNTEFRPAILDGSTAAAGPFDALVGRRVLMYLPDPVAALRGLVAALEPGGLVVCQEHDTAMTPGRTASLPLHEWLHTVLWRTVAHEGANVRMGFDLASVLTRAGLVVERVRAEALVQTPTTRQPAAPLIRLMLPRIVATGAATAEEVDVDTLDDRLARELRAADATYVGDVAFGALARKPR